MNQESYGWLEGVSHYKYEWGYSQFCRENLMRLVDDEPFDAVTQVAMEPMGKQHVMAVMRVVLTKHCHYCKKYTTTCVMWGTMRCRVCGECARERLVEVSSLAAKYNVIELREMEQYKVWRCMPHLALYATFVIYGLALRADVSGTRTGRSACRMTCARRTGRGRGWFRWIPGRLPRVLVGNYDWFASRASCMRWGSGGCRSGWSGRGVALFCSI